MIKAFVAACFVSFGLGSILGYVINEQLRSPIAQAQPTPVKPVTKPLDRQALERRYIACLGRDVNLIRFSDADLNNDLFDCERNRKAGIRD